MAKSTKRWARKVREWADNIKTFRYAFCIRALNISMQEDKIRKSRECHRKRVMLFLSVDLLSPATWSRIANARVNLDNEKAYLMMMLCERRRYDLSGRRLTFLTDDPLRKLDLSSSCDDPPLKYKKIRNSIRLFVKGAHRLSKCQAGFLTHATEQCF